MPTKEFYLPIYKIGSTVFYNDKIHTINGVYVSGWNVLLKLNDIAELVDSSLVTVEPTKFII